MKENTIKYFYLTSKIWLIFISFVISSCSMQGTIKTTTATATESSSNGGTCTTATNVFIKGGNSFGSNSSIGTADSYSLDFITNALPRLSISSSGNIGIGTQTSTITLDLLSKTDAVGVPSGTTAQRPSSPVNGMVRYNTTLSVMEAYVNGNWHSLMSTINTPTAPAGTGGTGYFVMTASTWDGNLGGLSGANTKCRTELSAGVWKNKPGVLSTNKIFAFLCDDGGCQNPQGLVNYYYAVVGDISLGGAGFSTDGMGRGPNDNSAWTSTDRFAGYGVNYWLGPRAWAPSTFWSSSSNNATPSCSNWTTSSGAVNGGYGNPSMTDQIRFYPTDAPCSAARPLICFVNP